MSICSETIQIFQNQLLPLQACIDQDFIIKYKRLTILWSFSIISKKKKKKKKRKKERKIKIATAKKKKAYPLRPVSVYSVTS